MWPDAERFMQTQKQLEDSKAQGLLQSWLTTSTSSDAKLEWALEHLLSSDEQFRGAVLRVVPDWQQLQSEGRLMEVLLEQLKRLQPQEAKQAKAEAKAKAQAEEGGQAGGAGAAGAGAGGQK